MKNTLIALAVIVVLGGGWWYYSSMQTSSDAETKTPSGAETSAPTGAGVPTDGTYTTSVSESTVNWAAGKPLIEGYINSGTIGLKEGTITVAGGVVSGTVTIDMSTIHVGNTAKKPGKESQLEGHLKSDDFFDVAKYPTGTFAITKIEASADSATTHQYSVTGDLTLKGQTHAVTFPALIYLEGAKVHLSSTFTVDRTKWGINYGSGSFFDNLANNVIEDNIHLTMSVVAVKQ